MHSQSIITVAVGNNYYYQLARNLIYSFLYHNANNKIIFNLVTDSPDAFLCFNELERVVISCLELKNEEKSFTAKFHLIEHALSGENLFIDCDCLVYRDLTPVFTELSPFNFTAIGTLQSEGSFFCDIPDIVAKFKIKNLPVFVGSVYYFKNNEITKQIFKQAAALKASYDEIGFIRLRGKENEEPLFALSMALNNEIPYEGNLNIKADAMFFREIEANVLKGTNSFELTDKKRAAIYRNTEDGNCFIVHYNASFSDHWLYHFESYRLARRNTYSATTELYGLLKYKLPTKSVETLKNFIRPTFRAIFGYRKIKKTERTQHLE